MVDRDVSVIRVMDADVDDVGSIRALLADALNKPDARVLADMSGLAGLGGPLIAAMLIVSREMGPDARFAVFAPEHIFQQMNDWKIMDAWPCFDEWDAATRYLCGEPGLQS